jgi:predicted transcriptional regulator
MAIAWARESVTVRDVADALEPETDSAYTTVMTVMSRLTDKGLLKRSQRGRAYLYKPKVTKDAYADALSQSRVRSLVDEFGDLAVAQFAREIQRVDPARAEMLARLLRNDEAAK